MPRQIVSLGLLTSTVGTSCRGSMLNMPNGETSAEALTSDLERLLLPCDLGSLIGRLHKRAFSRIFDNSAMYVASGEFRLKLLYVFLAIFGDHIAQSSSPKLSTSVYVSIRISVRTLRRKAFGIYAAGVYKLCLVGSHCLRYSLNETKGQQSNRGYSSPCLGRVTGLGDDCMVCDYIICRNMAETRPTYPRESRNSTASRYLVIFSGDPNKSHCKIPIPSHEIYRRWCVDLTKALDPGKRHSFLRSSRGALVRGMHFWTLA